MHGRRQATAFHDGKLSLCTVHTMMLFVQAALPMRVPFAGARRCVCTCIWCVCVELLLLRI